MTLVKEYPNWFVVVDNRDAYLGDLDADEVQQFEVDVPNLRRDPGEHNLVDWIYQVGDQSLTDEQHEEWVFFHNQFLAAFGMELQGSLRIIIVNDSRLLESADEFVAATRIVWNSPAVNGRYMLPKNSVVLVLFVSPSEPNTISLARAFTGMTTGNPYLQDLVAHSRLERMFVGQPLDAQHLLGGVEAVFGDGSIWYGIEDAGLIPQLLWGYDGVWGYEEAPQPFERVSMGDNYENLRYQSRPLFWGALWVITKMSLINFVVFFLLAIFIARLNENFL